MQTQSQQKQQINQPFFKTSTSATSYFLNFNNGNGNTRTPSQINVSTPPQQQQQQQHINVRPLNSQGETFFRQTTPARQAQRERGRLTLNCIFTLSIAKTHSNVMLFSLGFYLILFSMKYH